MKKFLLASFLLAAFSITKVNAQILNNGFETWVNQTAYFDGFGGFFPRDTFQFSDPENWTTTNALSGADTLGGFFLVTETANAHTGNKAIELTTRILDTVGTPLGARALTIPGLALNGKFPLNLGSNILAGGVISPAQISGAGQPFTQRLSTIKGFFNYAPVVKDSLGNLDSCTVWAVLRKGTKVVASAQFSSDSNTAGAYVAFSASFNYVDCDQPDTLVVLLAASIPNFGSILTGSTSLVPGSILRVDDLSYDTLLANYNFPPIANNDIDTTTKNVAKNILVKLNDADCNNGVAGLTLAVTIQPVHGTAAAVGTNYITYTPASNYVGVDSFFYSLSDGTGTATGRVRMLVLNTTGISESEADKVKILVFPVPASNELNVQFENNTKATIRIFDMVGNLVSQTIATSTNNAINIANLANGVYGIQIANENNITIARSKFTVSK